MFVTENLQQNVPDTANSERTASSTQDLPPASTCDFQLQAMPPSSNGPVLMPWQAMFHLPGTPMPYHPLAPVGPNMQAPVIPFMAMPVISSVQTATQNMHMQQTFSPIQYYSMPGVHPSPIANCVPTPSLSFEADDSRHASFNGHSPVAEAHQQAGASAKTLPRRNKKKRPPGYYDQTSQVTEQQPHNDSNQTPSHSETVIKPPAHVGDDVESNAANSHAPSTTSTCDTNDSMSNSTASDSPESRPNTHSSTSPPASTTNSVVISAKENKRTACDEQSSSASPDSGQSTNESEVTRSFEVQQSASIKDSTPNPAVVNPDPKNDIHQMGDHVPIVSQPVTSKNVKDSANTTTQEPNTPAECVTSEEQSPAPVKIVPEAEPVAPAATATTKPKEAKKPASWAGLFSGSKPAQDARVVYTRE